MNAIDLLESQHHEIEALFEKLLSAATREMKERFLLRLADSLAIHASIEEHHLFPATRQKRVPESLEEHLAIRRVLGDLLDVEVEDDTFDAKIEALLETVEHHVHAEEKNLFPKVKAVFDGLELDALGEDMSAEQAELEESGNARETVLREIDEGATLSPERLC
jgi:hemerythrin superfamily protein